jgi:uroporphyrinogen decarboxylase
MALFNNDEVAMPELTPKQRMRLAVQHQLVDRLPTQINYTNSMGIRLAEHFGIPLAALPERLGNHLKRLDISFALYPSSDGKARFDWWGVGWSSETEGYWPAVSPLADTDNMDGYAWPDPLAPRLLHDAEDLIAKDSGRHFLAPNFGFALFERAWALRGFEKLSMDLILNQGYVQELLDRITDIQVSLARRFVTLGVDGGYFGDDYGAQKGMLFSPRTWRLLFKPRLARMFAVFREAGLPVILHSDGDIAPILPDLVEIGLSVLNPVQPEVIDHVWLKQTYGDRLAFYGGVSTQSVLPFGSPEEVRVAARHAVETLAGYGTGLILAPSHRMTADISMENVEALLDVFSEL